MLRLSYQSLITVPRRSTQWAGFPDKDWTNTWNQTKCISIMHWEETWLPRMKPRLLFEKVALDVRYLRRLHICFRRYWSRSTTCSWSTCVGRVVQTRRYSTLSLHVIKSNLRDGRGISISQLIVLHFNLISLRSSLIWSRQHWFTCSVNANQLFCISSCQARALSW